MANLMIFTPRAWAGGKVIGRVAVVVVVVAQKLPYRVYANRTQAKKIITILNFA